MWARQRGRQFNRHAGGPGQLFMDDTCASAVPATAVIESATACVADRPQPVLYPSLTTCSNAVESSETVTAQNALWRRPSLRHSMPVTSHDLHVQSERCHSGSPDR